MTDWTPVGANNKISQSLTGGDSEKLTGIMSQVVELDLIHQWGSFLPFLCFAGLELFAPKTLKFLTFLVCKSLLPFLFWFLFLFGKEFNPLSSLIFDLIFAQFRPFEIRPPDFCLGLTVKCANITSLLEHLKCLSYVLATGCRLGLYPTSFVASSLKSPGRWEILKFSSRCTKYWGRSFWRTEISATD